MGDELGRTRSTFRRQRPGAVGPRRTLMRLNLRRGDADRFAEAIRALLADSGLTAEERVQLLGSAFVVEALRPHWTGDRTAEQAHERLRSVDPELADAVEALAPLLLGHLQVREDAGDAIATVESWLRAPRQG